MTRLTIYWRSWTHDVSGDSEQGYFIFEQLSDTIHHFNAALSWDIYLAWWCRPLPIPHLFVILVLLLIPGLSTTRCRNITVIVNNVTRVVCLQAQYVYAHECIKTAIERGMHLTGRLNGRLHGQYWTVCALVYCWCSHWTWNVCLEKCQCNCSVLVTRRKSSSQIVQWQRMLLPQTCCYCIMSSIHCEP